MNDYQIDAATPEGRVEYKRIMDRAAELGAEYVLYAPTQSSLARRKNSVDDWGWEIALTKAYSAVHSERRTFVGFYADVSLLDPDREYRVELDLPSLEPGRFQGLFFENVETEYAAPAR